LIAVYNDEYNIYKAAGNFQQALNSLNLKNQLQDSVFSAAKNRAILELEAKYDNRQRLKDITTLNHENGLKDKIVSSQKKFIVTLVLVSLLLLALAVVTYRSYQLKSLANQQVRTLMADLHHRVKNNLQILSGLFTMQIEYLTDEATKNALRENEIRLASMNMIHNKLYANTGNSKIEMRDYLTKLLTHIKESFGGDRERIILLRIDIDTIELEADKAVAIGLIVNELATNSFKYAFKGSGGEIHLKFKQITKSKICLSLQDNGIGLSPANQADPKSFGLKLVQLMARQLDTKLLTDNRNGLHYTMNIDN